MLSKHALPSLAVHACCCLSTGGASLAVHACCCLSTGGGVHQSGWCLPMYVSEGMSCSQMNGFHARLQLHPQRRSRSCLAYVCRLRPSPTILFVLIPGERQPVSVITSIVSHLLYKSPVRVRSASSPAQGHIYNISRLEKIRLLCEGESV